MIHRYSDHEAEFDEEFEDEVEERKPRFWVSALVCVALAATGSGAAFAFHVYGGGELMTGALTSAPKAASVPQAAAQDAVLKNLADAQQRAAVTAQRNQELLQAQAAEIKRLSDTVAQLATRVEGLSVRNAQAAVAAPPAPKKPAAPKVVGPKPAAPAPLSLAPEEKK